MVAGAKKADEEDNPFRVPPDHQIFAVREEARRKKAEEKEKAKSQRVWEKMTSSCLIARTQRVDDGTDDAQIAAEAGKKGRRGMSRSKSDSSTLGQKNRREKEVIADFVQQKREMFLVQMSLDVKKGEILKLDKRAKDKEDALNKSKQMLDEDIARFDTFLGNNDQRAHAAMKTAEEMTKSKQERIAKIKQLKSQLSAVVSEIAKHREQKEECLRLKEFLVHLTPVTWKELKAEEKKQRKLDRRKLAVDTRMADINARMSAEIEAEERAFQENLKESTKGRRRQKKTEEEEQKERDQIEARRRRIVRKYPTQAQIDSEYVDYSSGEEMPLYFREPKQLLDIFTDKEESNLFLIQNSQEQEKTLDELNFKFTDMQRTHGVEIAKVKQQIAGLERQIADERSKRDELRQALSQRHGGSEQSELLKELGAAVVDVHDVCSHEDQGDGDTLQMLARIEAKLEEYLAYLDEAEDSGFRDRVQAEEMMKERQRKLYIREKRKEQLERKIEERLKASLQRSQAPVHKKVGKQIMFRSAPLFQARKVVQEDDGYEEAVREHNVFGIWMDKDGVPNSSEPEKSADSFNGPSFF